MQKRPDINTAMPNKLISMLKSGDIKAEMSQYPDKLKQHHGSKEPSSYNIVNIECFKDMFQEMIYVTKMYDIFAIKEVSCEHAQCRNVFYKLVKMFRELHFTFLTT